MNTVELVHKRVALLPNEAQEQILEFVNFLMYKHEVEEEDEELLAEFLNKRMQQSQNGKRRSWKEVKADIYQKYYKKDV